MMFKLEQIGETHTDETTNFKVVLDKPYTVSSFIDTVLIVKGGNAMNYFLAVNDRQLGTCLRMLFAEGIQGIVQVVLNDKNKIEFHISIAADDNLLESLKERYTILIS